MFLDINQERGRRGGATPAAAVSPACGAVGFGLTGERARVFAECAWVLAGVGG